MSSKPVWICLFCLLIAVLTHFSGFIKNFRSTYPLKAQQVLQNFRNFSDETGNRISSIEIKIRELESILDKSHLKHQRLQQNITHKNSILQESLATVEKKLNNLEQNLRQNQETQAKNDLLYREMENFFKNFTENSTQTKTSEPQKQILPEQNISKGKYNFEPNLNPILNPTKPLHPVPSCTSENIFGKIFPPTLIHSFMGAGNTWLRQSIDTATGFYTGSAFNDKSLYNGGLRGEKVPIQNNWHQLIGIKTHNPSDAKGERDAFYLIQSQLETKCVILIRNPFDTFVAEYTRMISNSHTQGSNMNETEFVKKFQSNPEVLSWMGLGPKALKIKGQNHENQRWLHSYQKALDVCLNKDENSKKYRLKNPEHKSESHTAHLVFYEDLKSNFIQEIRKIAIYLQEYDEQRFQECIVDASHTQIEGRFHRKQHVEINPFSAEMISAIREMVILLNQTYPVLPENYLSASIKSGL